MIDYLTIAYKNYELIDLLVMNFKRLKLDVNLIVVDNTPSKLRQPFKNDYISKWVVHKTSAKFDGESHGLAIDCGLKHCTKDIICLFDSDFIITNPEIETIVKKEFDQGIKALGTEFYDGEPEPGRSCNWRKLREGFEGYLFEEMPSFFCGFIDRDIASLHTWTITRQEVHSGSKSSFMEVGWRCRKHLLENNIKTKTFKGRQKSPTTGYDHPCYFYYEDNLIGFHYQRGSSRKMEKSIIEINNILRAL